MPRELSLNRLLSRIKPSLLLFFHLAVLPTLALPAAGFMPRRLWHVPGEVLGKHFGQA